MAQEMKVAADESAHSNGSDEGGEDIVEQFHDNIPPLPYQSNILNPTSILSRNIIEARYRHFGTKLVNVLLETYEKILRPYLPSEIRLPVSLKQAMKYYDKHIAHSVVDVCVNECTIFGDKETHCPKCTAGRYNSNGSPKLQFRYINILHRIHEIYANPILAFLIRYPWNETQNEENTLRHIYDGKIWKEKFLSKYGSHDYNIALGLTMGNFFLVIYSYFYCLAACLFVYFRIYVLNYYCYTYCYY